MAAHFLSIFCVCFPVPFKRSGRLSIQRILCSFGDSDVFDELVMPHAVSGTGHERPKGLILPTVKTIALFSLF